MPPSSFSRPLPKGRRTRRGSDGGSMQGDDDVCTIKSRRADNQLSYTTQDSTPPGFKRHMSTSSYQRHRVSSNNSQLGSLTSPMQFPASPTSGLDESSFHGASFGLEPDETDGVENELDPRLSHFSVRRIPRLVLITGRVGVITANIARSAISSTETEH